MSVYQKVIEQLQLCVRMYQFLSQYLLLDFRLREKYPTFLPIPRVSDLRGIANSFPPWNALVVLAPVPIQATYNAHERMRYGRFFYFVPFFSSFDKLQGTR